MFKKSEIVSILIAVLILAFVVSLSKSLSLFPQILLAIFLVIIINVLAKKIQAFYMETEIEIKLWEMRRFWFKAHHKFKNPVPTGIFFPIVIVILSGGYLIWLASLVFETTGNVYRAARRHGLYNLSEVSELQIGIIATTGIIANLLAALVGYLLGYEFFATLNIYYAFFNIIPFSSLDGLKILFASKALYAILATIIIILVLGVFIIA